MQGLFSVVIFKYSKTLYSRNNNINNNNYNYSYSYYSYYLFIYFYYKSVLTFKVIWDSTGIPVKEESEGESGMGLGEGSRGRGSEAEGPWGPGARGLCLVSWGGGCLHQQVRRVL